MSLRAFKQKGIQLNYSETAKISGVSERYVYNHKAEVIQYYTQSVSCNKSDIDLLCDKSIKIGLQSAKTIDEALGLICGALMRYEHRLLHHLYRFKDAAKVGVDVVGLFKMTCSRKNNDGVPIHTDCNSVKRLLRQNKVTFVDKLFLRSDRYHAGNYSKRWKPTVLLETLMQKTVGVFLELCSVCVKHIVPHMFLGSTALSGEGYDDYSSLVLIPTQLLKTFEFKSIFLLLVSTEKVCESGLFVRIKHESRLDESLGRTYNVFCNIRSWERLELGYNAYDMQAALQSISLQLVNGSEKDYPLLWKYTRDGEFKMQVRSKIAGDLNIDVADVKSKLTAFANGAVSGVDKHRYYREFQEESDRLRRNVMKAVLIDDPAVIRKAEMQSKRIFPEYLDWSDVTSNDSHQMMKDKSSVFFYVWTWYERLIRKAMLSILPDGIEVHDAVYSKKDVSCRILEQIIKEKTGFDIIIECSQKKVDKCSVLESNGNAIEVM